MTARDGETPVNASDRTARLHRAMTKMRQMADEATDRDRFHMPSHLEMMALTLEQVAGVSEDLDHERASRIRLAHALVSLAENLKRPGKATDTDIAYYGHLIDAIADLTT